MDLYQIYVILFMLGSVLLTGLWLYLRQIENRIPTLNTLSSIILLEVGVLAFQFFEISAKDLNTKVLFLNLKFSIYSMLPVLLLKFGLEYTGEMKPAWQGVFRFLWSATLIAGILAITSPYHTLFRYDYVLNTANPLASPDQTYGPFFYLHQIMVYGMGISTVVLWVTAYRAKNVHLKEFMVMILAVAIPFLAIQTSLWRFSPLPGFNIGPLANATAAFVYWFGLSRLHLFDLKPVAHSIILERMTDAMLIVDKSGRVVDLNPAARALLPAGMQDAIGQSLSNIIPGENPLQLQDQYQTEITLNIEEVARDYAVRISLLHEKNGRHTGWLLLFQDVTLRKQSEGQKRKLAALEERERLGRDLHDDIGQVLGFFNVQTQSVSALLDQQKIGQAQVELARLISVAQKGQSTVRRYILDLRVEKQTEMPPPAADFVSVLSDYLNSLFIEYNFEADLYLPDDLPDLLLAPLSELQLLRIIQEALTNVRKYAGTNLARIYIEAQAENIQVVIEDQGAGFDPLAVAGDAHFGLQIMRERAASVSGTFTAESQPGSGTRLTVVVPRILSGVENAPAWRVLLVDDHSLFREGLRTLLSVRGINIVGIAENGLDALEQTRALLPDLILMDVDMPQLNGVEATRRIKAEFPDARIVMLTVSADDETLFGALRAGASGYLLKNLDDKDFYRLLKNIMRGESVLSPGLAARVLAEFEINPIKNTPVENQPPITPLPQLTERQYEVLDYAAQGLIYKEIGQLLHLSERTIRYHMGQILNALQVQNSREAIMLARRQGLG